MQRTPDGRHAARHRQPDLVEPKAARPHSRVRWAAVIGVVSATAGVSLALGLGHSSVPTHDTADVPLDGATVLSSPGIAQDKYNQPAPGHTSSGGGSSAPLTWFHGLTPSHRHFHRQAATRSPDLRSSSPSSSPTPTPSQSSVSSPPSGQPPTGQPPTGQPSTSPTPTPSPDPTPAPASTNLSAPSPTAEYQTPTGANQLAWSEAILTALGAPITDANVESLGYWMQNEAGSPPSGIVGANNPINVSQPGDDGTPIKSEGCCYSLYSYPTVQDGVDATVTYLERSSYTQIVAALKAGDGLTSSSLASELSVYSGGGYSEIPDSWGASQGTPELPPSS
jgi:hypothetical protein